MTRALRVAIVGAESTGKSMLARALTDRLHADFGLRCLCVAEFLREWCDARGRTPRPDEQEAIALEQQRRIDTAAAEAGVDVVVCDTTPMMTAVYSDLLFNDRSLDEFACRCQQGVDTTLLTALDLPWVADGLQRDGPHVRATVDTMLRARLLGWGVTWSLVAGQGRAREDAALDALRPLLRRYAEGATPSTGLFSRLSGSRGGPPAPAWVCTRCDDAQCEHESRRQARR